MRATLADLPQRWRNLLTLPDDQLAQGLVPPPSRSLTDRDQDMRAKDLRLPHKLTQLEIEFTGQPLACLAHAALVVLLRRDQAQAFAAEAYFRLWDRHEALLLDRLSLRWLISAADTLADHGRTPAERATAFASVLLANTIKLYETERFLSLAPTGAASDQPAAAAPFDLDGITYFSVARGDTVANMYQRKNSLVGELGLAGKLLDQVMTRVNRLDTVYARFRKHHTGKHPW